MATIWAPTHAFPLTKNEKLTIKRVCSMHGSNLVKEFFQKDSNKDTIRDQVEKKTINVVK